MSATYELWLTDDLGRRLQPPLTTWTALEWAMATNEVGWLTLTFADDRLRPLFRRNRRIYVWRQPEGGRMGLVRSYFVRRVERGYNGANRYFKVGGPDSNDLLRTRVVAYDEATTQDEKTGPADDLMKAYVADNLGADATDADRNITALGFSVEANASAGPSVDMSGARQQVLDVLQALANAAKVAGTRVVFDVANNGSQDFIFRTYIGQRGRDRRCGVAQRARLFSMEQGNISDPVLVEDATEEVTVVYGLGTGVEGIREVAEVEDTARTGAARFNRREASLQASNLDDTETLTDVANAALHEGRPKTIFRANLLESPGARYQVDYGWGDLVTVAYENERYDCEVKAITGRVERGVETLEVKLEDATA